jgi:hypothetical protein
MLPNATSAAISIEIGFSNEYLFADEDFPLYKTQSIIEFDYTYSSKVIHD